MKLGVICLIENIKKIFKGLFFIFDSLEFVIVGIFASISFLAVPFYLIKNIYEGGQLLLALILSSIVIASFGVCIRDVNRKKWSALSICIVVFWGICFLIVGWTLMF